MTARPSRDQLIRDMTRALLAAAEDPHEFNAYEWGWHIARFVPALVARTHADTEARIAGYLWELDRQHGIDRLDLDWTAEYLVAHVAQDLGVELAP